VLTQLVEKSFLFQKKSFVCLYNVNLVSIKEKMEIKKQKTKTLVTRDNGRSSDAISPNFIYGCLGGCMKSYCYVARYNHDKVYINENTEQILASIYAWVDSKPWPKVPNQVDDTYYCVDIGCSTDVPLHSKHYNWQQVFDFFNTQYKLKTTFATKYPTKFKLQEYNLTPGKHRIRVSLMPQFISSILEPNTDSIADRIAVIPILQTKMEVHINFSPIVYYPTWLEDYEELFKQLQGIEFKSECIFMTYNVNQFSRNSGAVNYYLWQPTIQESKNSQYAADNIRYQWQFKNNLIEQFKNLYKKYFPLETIRYIF
jgi:spore photoproduct lyase